MACAAPVHRAEPRGAPDQDLLSLLPAGADALFDLEPATLAGLPGSERLLGELPSLWRALAADPWHDLSAIALAWRSVGAEEVEAALVARGRPSWVRLSAALRAESPDAAEVDYHGVAVLEGRSGRAAAMLTPRTAAVGSRTAVRQMIDNARGDTEGLRGQPELMAALGKAPRARQGRPALLAALLPPAALRERLRKADLGELGADADYLALSLAVGDGIDIGVVAGFRDLGQARAVRLHLQDRVEALRRRPALAFLGVGEYLEPLVIVAALAGALKRDPELHLAYRLAGVDLAALVAKLEKIAPLRQRARGQNAP